MTEPIARFDEVTKRFGDLVVLDRLALEVAPNEKVAVIGPSGSGKSTLLRLLMTLEPVTEGVIWIRGEPLNMMYDRRGNLVPADENHLRRLRGNVGMVFQHFHLFPHMSALGNVIEGPIHVLGLGRKVAEERGRDLLNMVGLADKIDQYPAMLSGGQQQRVAIARALAMRPNIMLFDEVTSALDPELVGEVLNTIRRIATDYDITMILVTHEMGFAREFADRVCFFDEGRIMEQGAPADVLGNPQNPRTREFLHAVLG